MFYVTEEVAEITGLSVQRIQQYCRKNNKPKKGTQFYLTDEDIKIIQILKRKRA